MSNNLATSGGRKLLPFIPTIVIGICLLAAGIYIDRLNRHNFEVQLRHQVSSQLGIIRAQLEGDIHSNAQLVQGLVASIKADPDMSQAHFTALARHLLEQHSQLRNIAAAPDLVIRYMYPVAGNEAAIGLDYRSLPDQIDVVLLARDTGKLIIAGPVDLVQGGRGFIARIPVFLNPDNSNGSRFWGLVSLVIDQDRLYRSSGLLDESQDIIVTIRGKDGSGERGERFFGPDDVFSRQPERLDVKLPHGSWQLAAVPNEGWEPEPGHFLQFNLAITCIGLALLISSFLLGRSYRTNRENAQRLQGLFDLSPVGIALNDYRTGKFLEVNDALLKSTGHSRQELLGLTNADITPVEYREQENSVIESLKQTRRYGPYEKEYLRKDKSRYPVLMNGIVIVDTKGDKRVWSIIEDMSYIKQAEKALAETAKQLELVISATAVGIWDWHVQTGEVVFNERWAEIIGYRLDELQPITIDTWLKHAHPDDLQESEQRLQAHWRGEADRYICEARMKHKDGHWIWVLDTGSTVEWDAEGKPVRMIGTHVDISERKAVEKELITTRDAAEKANRAKSDFLSGMSHELRTPLNAILGFGQLLEIEDPTRQQQKYITEVIKAGRHLLTLISEVLDLAKVESGRVELLLQTVRLDDVIEDCMTLVRTAADNMKINLIIPETTGIVVTADYTRLKQALLNLLSNAIKYNSRGGTVSVVVQNNSEERIQIRVTDTGDGISPERLPELFEPFNRLGAEYSDTEGTGIGLTLTRQIVQMMGGDVGVESSPGSGSTFWIELPADTSTGTGDLRADTSEDTDCMTTHGPVSISGKRTILCIEDNDINLDLLERILEKREYISVLKASNARDGLVVASEQRPDLILLDINLPDIDGYMALDALREQPALKSIPVFAITANAMPDDVKRGMAAGFSEYVTKPIEVAPLLELVDRYLST